MKKFISITALALVGQGCFPTGSGTAKLSHANSATQLNVVMSEDGEEASAAFSATSKETQVLAAPSGSPIAGVTTSFPPGSLGISADISIGPGAGIVDQAELTEKLGLKADTTFAELGSSISIQASVDMDARVPFTLAIPIPESALHLTQNQNYAVVYKSEKVKDNSLAIGIIPQKQITVKDGVATFSSTHFGTYQLVLTSTPIKEKVEAKLSTFVAAKPVTINKVKPFVADAGKKVTIFGEDFSGQMKMTLADRVIRKVDIQSDSKASFVVPRDVKFGFTNLKISQANQDSQYGLMARSNDKLDYPLITIEASGVCDGVKYYDAQGDLQTGTKTCTSTTTTASSGGVDGTDADGNGIVDEADKAGYALGVQGSQISVAPHITLPNDGNYFKLVGTGTVNSISSKPSGSRITLTVESRVDFSHLASTSNALMLEGFRPLKAKPGDMVEFISNDSGNWMQLNHTTSTTGGFQAAFSGTLTATEGAHTKIPIAIVHEDAWNGFDATTHQYTIPQAGTYYFFGTMKMSWSGPTDDKSDGYLKVFKNGNYLVTLGSCYVASGDEKDCNILTTSSSGQSLAVNDVIEFKVSSFNKATGNAAGLVTNATAIMTTYDLTTQ